MSIQARPIRIRNGLTDSIKTASSIATILVLLIVACDLVALEKVSFVFIGATGSSAHKGAQQGVAEANIQGHFLGQNYALLAFEPDAQPASLPADTRAIIAAVDKQTVLAISTDFPDFPVFNVGLADDGLRDACHDNLLHTLPSNRMMNDALAQWHRKKPASQAIAGAWHSSFTRYAAAQLNKRFMATHGIVMDDISWAAWAAVKMSSDTIARSAAGKPERSGHLLLSALRTDLAFDGQKGSAMSFRNNGQMRQPLLLIENGKVVGEAPVRGIASSLDSLGVAECPK
jgi:hypothetical protein